MSKFIVAFYSGSSVILSEGTGISIYEDIYHILAPSKMGEPTLSYIVLGSALLFEGAACGFALRGFTHNKDA